MANIKVYLREVGCKDGRRKWLKAWHVQITPLQVSVRQWFHILSINNDDNNDGDGDDEDDDDDDDIVEVVVVVVVVVVVIIIIITITTTIIIIIIMAQWVWER